MNISEEVTPGRRKQKPNNGCLPILIIGFIGILYMFT